MITVRFMLFKPNMYFLTSFLHCKTIMVDISIIKYKEINGAECLGSLEGMTSLTLTKIREHIILHIGIFRKQTL